MHSAVRFASDDLVEVLQSTCAESQAAAEEARRLRAKADDPQALSDGVGQDAQPGLVRRVSMLQERLGHAAARLRRTHAAALHRAGIGTE